MARDECGTEFRPSGDVYETEELANEALTPMRERYPEARGMWVELNKDKAYYAEEREWLYEQYGPDWMDYQDQGEGY